MRSLFMACLLTGAATMGITMQSNGQVANYDNDALRVDAGPGLQIVRGAADSVVLKIGEFKRSQLTRLVASSPNAVAQAEIFDKNYRPGSWYAGAGLALFGLYLGMNTIQPRPAFAGWLIPVSVGLIAYGGYRLKLAYRGLQKAVWWYNRDLKS
jgi:hypothetical protein